MSPLGVGNSHSTNTLQTGEAKLWVLLVGINQYEDGGLPSLRYPAVDCQGLGEALFKATQGFPQKEVIVHHDFALVKPTATTVRQSLQYIVSQTRSQDTILLYFSGHGILEPDTQQAVLCMTDTEKNNLLNTGIPMQELLQMLGNSSAHQQLVCLDTCHSGDMVLRGNNGTSRDAENPSFNSTSQMLQVLRQRASQSKGFCALLSCDQGQKSWEFPELGHGVFTYFLMRGLLGEAADSQGIIEADGLYKFVYRQTLQYIDKLNQQLRLINQQKRNRGDYKIQPEYPLQTPKRIVEGVGELILGFKANVEVKSQPRHGLIVDGLGSSQSTNQTINDLSRVLRGAGGFELECFPHNQQNLSAIRSAIQTCLRTSNQKENSTTLLYLRGEIEEIEDGEAWLILGNGVRLSRSSLRQELRRGNTAQLIIILDCPGATTLENWLEDLNMGVEQPQCIIASASTPEQPDAFSQAILTTLAISNPQQGLPVAAWINQLRSHLKDVDIHVWLSGTRGVIDILPGNVTSIFAHEPKEIVATTNSAKIQPQPNLETSTNFPNFSELDEKAIKSLFTPGSKEYSQLEHLLTSLMGPIAPTLIRRTLSKITNPRKQLEELTIHLIPEQKIEFTAKVTQIIETLVLQPQSKSVLSVETQLEPTFIQKCDRELINLIGPIGNFIVKEVYKTYSHVSPSEFVQKLAEEIPNKQIAEQFLQQFVTNLQKN
ncbi:caspase family protein [Brunnivagina elsteri]|uniref:Peptidase C14 n=1 Tax=Brunnivagina elsteri CCALA 953 TaxID=987040 RepID=A0A2A2TAZ8_9CYAN|nr:caspase domain-containing protein [Calothrix elsteri]PAX48937.1 peptidase C14 [Calothrix elsteri CCALA 953]